MVSATAPGKVILVGEHAVVYGRPAIAVPVWERVARATLTPLPRGAGCLLVAPDLEQSVRLVDAPPEDALALVLRGTLAALGLPADPDWRVEVRSDIPMASGLGSGAAIMAALVRAVYAQAGCDADPAQVSALVYQGETILHGTPSGIDNTVVAFGAPIWFVKDHAPQVFRPAQPFTLAIADSGAPGLTRATVAAVRRLRDDDPSQVDGWFDEIGALVGAARRAIEQGEIAALGPIFDQNHRWLQQLGVSTPLLDRLVEAARHAGALGAKLSGGGGGGNLIALVTPSHAAAVGAALEAAGAVRVVVTTVI
jgi:mevalonate kinase